MNDFQAILTIVTLFALRIGIPALVIYVIARLVNHYYGPDLSETEVIPQERIAY